MFISKQKPAFQPVVLDNKPFKVEDQAKLLGITFNNTLTWNSHIEDIVKKVSKRLYFLVQLKRAEVSINDLGLFYITCVRSVIDYAVPVFHCALPKYLIEELERIQKRAMAIIFPECNYQEALDRANICKLEDHHKHICNKLFKDIKVNA